MNGLTCRSDTSITRTDVTILGGGLAGLTLALQLRRQYPDLCVTVLEKRRAPFPTAIHKIGESTVEIGAHYLQDVVGLADHLQEAHLRKFGLRLFFGEAPQDFSQADELGTTRELAVPTWQIDRGVLETHMISQLRSLGSDIIDGCRVKSLDISSSRKVATIQTDSGVRTIQSRWLIDAAGRTSVIKPRFGLARPSPHRGDAVWFRIAKRIDIDEWSSCSEWRSRCGNGNRWLSTNHLMGPGYWVWIIPLASGATSIGIVTDPEFHSVDTFRDWPCALAWLEIHQPRLHGTLNDADVEPLDYKTLRNYPHDCASVMSDDRWALTGEAGVFLDPFYSPGTDFIGIGNTFIADLIGRDLKGEDIGERVANYERLYFTFYRSTLLLYQDLYCGFGDASLMNLKTVWDYAYYWGILAPMFFAETLTDDNFMSSAIVDLAKTQRLNRDIQSRFRERAAKAKRQRPSGKFVDQSAIPCLDQYNRSLATRVSPGELVNSIHETTDDLHHVARLLSEILENGPVGGASETEQALLGDLRLRLAD